MQLSMATKQNIAELTIIAQNKMKKFNTASS